MGIRSVLTRSWTWDWFPGGRWRTSASPSGGRCRPLPTGSTTRSGRTAHPSCIFKACSGSGCSSLQLPPCTGKFIGVPWVAGLAGLLFALDDAHGLPAGWIANRNALIAGFFGVLGAPHSSQVEATTVARRRHAGSAGASSRPAFGRGRARSDRLSRGIFSLPRFREPPEETPCASPVWNCRCIWFITYSLLGYGTWGSGFYVDPVSEPLHTQKLSLSGLLCSWQTNLPCLRRQSCSSCNLQAWLCFGSARSSC